MVDALPPHRHHDVLVTSSDIHIVMYVISRHDVGHNKTTEAAWVSGSRCYCCTSKPVHVMQLASWTRVRSLTDRQQASGMDLFMSDFALEVAQRFMCRKMCEPTVSLC